MRACIGKTCDPTAATDEVCTSRLTPSMHGGGAPRVIGMAVDTCDWHKKRWARLDLELMWQGASLVPVQM